MVLPVARERTSDGREVPAMALRLQRLEDAADRIRELNRSLAEALETPRIAQRERDRTLRFLSHDLCPPHLSILARLERAADGPPSGSQVELGLERDGGGWRLPVSDRGPGVDPADRTRIFEPWWRGRDADPSTGVGLGLAFAATVAERHGGTARALGRDGEGARIELRLPDGVEPAPSE